MAAVKILLFAVAVAVALSASAADPDSLQDVCVADLTSAVKINGFPCKSNISEVDFFSDILSKPGATNNTFGSLVTGANVQKVPGLNTLGVSLSRIDYAPGGINPPHTHPRATEVVFVLEEEQREVASSRDCRLQQPAAGDSVHGATLFAASPPVPDNVLTKAFQIGTKEVQKIKSRFAPKK
ncbi:hypothetical protein LWI29_014409 [Acer saccharum]|uniref:Cupin type-1 domain-containing protein n=1 Tax=Acer saccharum TaxID=4024 RepID=A0AA39SDG5_ACESA|nr:hypothetical protein LWI29_014409 [Acer saccharum]